MKLFAAIRPDPDTVRDLVRLQTGVGGAEWSAPEKLHITLGYFGEVSAAQFERLKADLSAIDMSAFEILLAGAGHFGGAEPRALWVGAVPSDALTRLYMHCRRCAKFAKIEMETTPFMPHVTLAYLRQNPCADEVAAFEARLAHYEAGPFRVESFNLYSTHEQVGGPNTYTQEAAYPLKGLV